MSTIIDVISRMSITPKNIVDVYKSGDEYYFRFGSHAFSILRRTGDREEYGEYSVFLYPKWTGTLRQLAGIFDAGPQDEPMLAYHQGEYTDLEDRQAFSTLYKAIEEKCFNVDFIFNDILSS